MDISEHIKYVSLLYGKVYYMCIHTYSYMHGQITFYSTFSLYGDKGDL